MSYLGIRNFRFSISWPRIFPTGRPPLNPPGIEFYKRVIATLRRHCIEPFVTLYHWDLPLPLYEEYGGFISRRVQDDFLVYAEAVWMALGDDVTYWTTFNEPETFCAMGYETGVHAPGRCSDRSRCAEGNSTTEGWLCAYNVLVTHARAEQLFRKVVPRGKLSMTLSMSYIKPLTESAQDVAACQRLMEFGAGRYLDPLYFGDWGPTLKNNMAAGVLPAFSAEEVKLLQGIRHDFLALQHYTSVYGGFSETAWLQACK
jgi:beta-glucosidase